MENLKLLTNTERKAFNVFERESRSAMQENKKLISN